MENYNIRLTKLRGEKGLSLKEAASQIGISRLKLYFYENGYFRPTKNNLKKINEFYQIELSLTGEDAYPAPSENKAIKRGKENLKGKRIAYGLLSAFFALLITIGAILFTQSINNPDSHYGEAYSVTHQKVVEYGDYGYDLVTSLQYYYSHEETDDYEANIVFYQSNNILYFNEMDYSCTVFNGTLGLTRYHYHFGFNLGVNSYVCEFTYGSVIDGTYFTCSFLYDNQPVSHVDNFKVVVEGIGAIDEAFALNKVNSQINNINPCLSRLLNDSTNMTYDFYNDFLPAREQGRVINFALQITGLILIFGGIVGFFIFIGLFIKALTKNIKPRLVLSESESEGKTPLPEDIRIRLGIPDVIIVLFGKILQYGSMIMFFVAFLAKFVPFLSGLSNPVFLNVFRWGWLSGVFLEYFVMIGRIKKPTVLFNEIIYNFSLFLFIATIETVIISVTNAWGYDFASIIYKYVPGNVYQVVAIHYLIYLFLFFQPSFLNKKGTGARVVWHSLSIIPLGALVVAYFFSNQYALVYGVKENIFMNFWFPNAFLLLSIVSVLYLYVTFFLRLHYERKFGIHNAQYFFYGDRYSLIENGICALLIAIVTSLDFLFVNNQYAYYLGLGGHFWMYFLIPFVLVCKYSPNNQQIFLIDEGFSRLVGVEKENK